MKSPAWIAPSPGLACAYPAQSRLTHARGRSILCVCTVPSLGVRAYSKFLFHMLTCARMRSKTWLAARVSLTPACTGMPPSRRRPPAPSADCSCGGAQVTARGCASLSHAHVLVHVVWKNTSTVLAAISLQIDSVLFSGFCDSPWIPLPRQVSTDTLCWQHQNMSL